MIIMFNEDEWNEIIGVANSTPNGAKMLLDALDESVLADADISEYNGRTVHRVRINRQYAVEFLQKYGRFANIAVPTVVSLINQFKSFGDEIDTLTTNHIARRNKEIEQKKAEAMENAAVDDNNQPSAVPYYREDADV